MRAQYADRDNLVNIDIECDAATYNIRALTEYLPQNLCLSDRYRGQQVWVSEFWLASGRNVTSGLRKNIR